MLSVDGHKLHVTTAMGILVNLGHVNRLPNHPSTLSNVK